MGNCIDKKKNPYQTNPNKTKHYVNDTIDIKSDISLQ